MRLNRTIHDIRSPNKEPSNMIRVIPVALAVPLLATAFGCSRPTELAELNVPPAPIVRSLEKSAGPGYKCEPKKVVHVDSICVANCDPVTDWMFNSGSAAVMVDCSRGRFYHKFAYNFSGTELLWEGFGDDSTRMFIRRDGEKVQAVRTFRHGDGWASDHLLVGQDAESTWIAFVKQKTLGDAPRY